MKTYLEPAKEIPIAGKVDVLVLGGGPAGFSAALSAGRERVSVMLIEQTGELGGVATSGLMSHWTGATRGGLFQEIIEKTIRSYCPIDHDYYPLINHEYLKNWMMDQLLKADVSVKLYTFASDAIMKENRLVGVITESKDGRQAVFADIVIDCTGDGDIAARAGAPYILGRESDNRMQPMTLMLQIAGVNRKQIHYLTEFGMDWEIPGGSIQQLARKALTTPAGHVLIYPTVYPDNVILNMTNCINVDGTKAGDLTKAHIVCRRQIPEILRFFREQVPGFGNAYLIKTASTIGVRETRHFQGLETITEDDILEARVFENWVATKLLFNFDVHGLTGPGLDETGSQLDFPQTKGYTIPYGCLVPVKTDGLLLAGRNISGTHLAHSNYRVMPICANVGQAAGVAAAMCVSLRVQPRDLEVRKLQKRLAELGVTP